MFLTASNANNTKFPSHGKQRKYLANSIKSERFDTQVFFVRIRFVQIHFHC